MSSFYILHTNSLCTISSTYLLSLMFFLYAMNRFCLKPESLLSLFLPESTQRSVQVSSYALYSFRCLVFRVQSLPASLTRSSIQLPHPSVVCPRYEVQYEVSTAVPAECQCDAATADAAGILPLPPNNHFGCVRQASSSVDFSITHLIP